MKTFKGSFIALAIILVRNTFARCDLPPRVPIGIGVTRQHTIHSNGRQRNYLLHIPKQYNPENPSPVILSFHGAGANMAIQESLSQFSNETVNPYMLAVYPDGEMDDSGERVWDGPEYASDTGARRGVDDKAFTADLLDRLASDYCVDTSRIYATGKSDGAGFVDRLACDLTLRTRFAAFAMSSAALYNDTGRQSCSDANPPIPILEFHGTNDTVIPYFGGSRHGEPLPPISSWADWWSLRDGCVLPPMIRDMKLTAGGKTENVQHVSHTCKGVKNVVNHYRIDGMGHDWPSTKPNTDNAKDGGPTVIDATPLIMEFLNANVKPAS